MQEYTAQRHAQIEVVRERIEESDLSKKEKKQIEKKLATMSKKLDGAAGEAKTDDAKLAKLDAMLEESLKEVGKDVNDLGLSKSLAAAKLEQKRQELKRMRARLEQRANLDAKLKNRLAAKLKAQEDSLADVEGEVGASNTTVLNVAVEAKLDALAVALEKTAVDLDEAGVEDGDGADGATPAPLTTVYVNSRNAELKEVQRQINLGTIQGETKAAIQTQVDELVGVLTAFTSSKAVVDGTLPDADLKKFDLMFEPKVAALHVAVDATGVSKALAAARLEQKRQELRRAQARLQQKQGLDAKLKNRLAARLKAADAQVKEARVEVQDTTAPVVSVDVQAALDVLGHELEEVEGLDELEELEELEEL